MLQPVCLAESSSTGKAVLVVECSLSTAPQEAKGPPVCTVAMVAPCYQTLSADTISKKMFDIVDEVNVVFQLPTPYVRLLLIACKWDKEKLLERCVGRLRWDWASVAVLWIM